MPGVDHGALEISVVQGNLTICGGRWDGKPMSPRVRSLPRMEDVDGIGLDQDGWLVSLRTEGGLIVPFLFPHSELLTLVDYLRRARSARGWPNPPQGSPRRSKVQRQAPIRVRKMGSVGLGTDDDGATIQVETAEDEVASFFLPKAKAVRIIQIVDFLLKRAGWGRLDSQCFYYSGRDRCRLMREGSSNFCRRHAQSFNGQTNRELLGSAATAFRKIEDLLRKRIDASQQDDQAMADWANCLSELGARGYRKEDVIRALKASLGDPGQDFGADAAKDPKWRKFEKLAFGVYLLRAEGALVSFDETIIGQNSGRKRQVDICVRFKHAFSDYFTMVECRDKRVSISEVEALQVKKADVGAARAIIVTSEGYQKGALDVAEHYGIDVHELSEERVDWTRTIREEVYRIPFPRSVEFDMPAMAPANDSRHIGPVRFADINFFDEEGNRRFDLASVLVDVGSWAHEIGLALPCSIDLRFDEGTSFESPRGKLLIPVYGLKFVLEEWEVGRSIAIDIPPHVTRYRYSDVRTGIIEEISPQEVGKALRYSLKGQADDCS